MSNQGFGTDTGGGKFLPLFYLKTKQAVFAHKPKDGELVTGTYLGRYLTGYRIGQDKGNEQHDVAPHNAIFFRFGYDDPYTPIRELKMDINNRFFGDIVNRLMTINDTLAAKPPVYFEVYEKNGYTNLSVKEMHGYEGRRYDWALPFSEAPGPLDHPFKEDAKRIGEMERDYRWARAEWQRLFVDNVAPYLPLVGRIDRFPEIAQPIINGCKALNKEGVTPVMMEKKYAPSIIREANAYLLHPEDKRAVLDALNETYAARGGKGYFTLDKEGPTPGAIPAGGVPLHAPWADIIAKADAEPFSDLAAEENPSSEGYEDTSGNDDKEAKVAMTPDEDLPF